MKPEDSAPAGRPSFPVRAAGLLLFLLALVQPLRAGDPPVLTCEPKSLTGVPGEPLRVTLTVESRSAAPMVLHIPESPLLTLRAVEKFPIRLTTEKTVVQERVVIWQGLEAGTVTLNDLSAEIGGVRFPFPPVKITVVEAGK